MCSEKTETPKNVEEIDENLRRAYQDLLNEALPDRFVTLLDQLRRGDSAGADQQRDEAND